MHHIVPGTINATVIISLGEDHAFTKSELDFHPLALKYFTLPKGNPSLAKMEVGWVRCFSHKVGAQVYQPANLVRGLHQMAGREHQHSLGLREGT